MRDKKFNSHVGIAPDKESEGSESTKRSDVAEAKKIVWLGMKGF